MKISIFGLGYVGAVMAACLARDGHEIIGVDVNKEKVDLVNGGSSPFVEPGLEELVAANVRSGRLRATTSAADAIAGSEISLVSVGTPQSERGEPELGYVFKVWSEIAEQLRKKQSDHVLVLRSTVPPGTLRRCRELLEEVAPEVNVGIAFNPEFLREGTAIRDYDSPPYTIIGTDHGGAERALREVYGAVDAPVVVVAPEVAEMTKYVANAWHATKVCFANEIGRIARSHDVDGRDVMNLIVQDAKLNISPVYMRPGFAYGGSCLPKDLAALLFDARQQDVEVPMLRALPATNDLQIELAVQEVLRHKSRRVAVLGLTFKPNTDDLRQSPTVPLVKRLIGEGYDISIYDPALSHSHLMGTNLAFIQANLPHFERLLVTGAEEALKASDAVVVSHNTGEFREAVLSAEEGTVVIDLVGMFDTPPTHLAYRALV